MVFILRSPVSRPWAQKICISKFEVVLILAQVSHFEKPWSEGHLVPEKLMGYDATLGET